MMIQIYGKSTTVFSRNGRALHEALSCYVDEELNGKHEAELEYPLDKTGKWKELSEGSLIKVDGQIFRIYNKKKTLQGISVNARHLFYDNLDNFLEDVRPENLSGVLAGQWIMARTQYPNLFTVSGTLGGNATRYFIRKNVVEAFMGDTGIINTWGGEIEHDNYNIILHGTRGLDRDVHIRYGKNILGIEETLNLDEVCTRMMPVGKDGLLLPEKYIDSPYLANYPYPKIKTYDFSDAETEADLRTAAQALMDNGEIDIPKVNYKVDFIELSKTEEYKDYAVLERIYLGDTVTIKHSKLGFDLKARVIKVKKNILTGRNENLELGYFLPNLASSSNSVGNVLINMAELIRNNKSSMQQAIDDATLLLTTALGGYVVKRNGEILIMDTEDPMTAVKLWRWNLNGFGYSKTGINGPFELAITMDGKVVANTAFFNSIVTNLIASDIGSSLNLTSNISITNLVENAVDQADLTLAADALTLKFSKAGGKNLIARNSGFTDGLNGWTVEGTGAVVETSTLVPSGKYLKIPGELGVSKRAYQSFAAGFDPNAKKWTISGFIRNNFSALGANPYANTQITVYYTDATADYFKLNESNAEVYYWKKVVKTIATSATKTISSFRIENIVADTSGGNFYASSFTLEEGEVVHTWSNGDNEIMGASHVFSAEGYKMLDSNGAEIFSLSKGMANEQNQSSTQNVQDGYPLNMTFKIGDTTALISTVEIRMKQYPFRTDSAGAASGGGATSGPSSKLTADSWDGGGGIQSQAPYGGLADNTHTHFILASKLVHAHGMAHSHTIYDHIHGVVFGIRETPNVDGTIYVDIDGVQRFATTLTDMTKDITAWVTTNGVHDISLRSPTLKRIQMDLYIKSYIRR